LALGKLHMGQVQLPLTHTRFCAHATRQPPQFLTSAPVGVSQPFWELPSQLANPARQESMTHCFATQAPLALGKLHTGQSHWPLTQTWFWAHTTPHLPQLILSTSRLISQPLL